MLRRITLAVFGYDEARTAGAKHLAAVEEAVRFVRSADPRMRISTTEVKRILAEWRPAHQSCGLFVVKPDLANSVIILPNGQVARIGLTAGWAPRPSYPRANAALKPT